MKKLANFLRMNYEKIAWFLVVLFLFLLRFLPISYGDVLGDGAINSFRALGWFDWLGYSGQSTPFEWLGSIPLWALFSFHDAPPVGFLLQHIFFVIFGNGTVVARLPFVLAGVGSVFITYYFLKKISGPFVASVAAILYSIVSYSIWAEHAMFLEGIEEFFIVASIFFGAYFLLKDQKKKYIYFWGIATTLALLTKYTALFLVPSIFIYAILFRKNLKPHLKHIIFSILVCLILISPVFIYNAKMYQLRGHFDAAFSSIVGMHPADFSIISGRSVSPNVFVGLKSLFFNLAANVSYPLFALSLVSMIFLIWKIRSRGFRTFESWIIFNTFFLCLLFAFAGQAERFLSIFVPFIVIITALGVGDIFEKIKGGGFRYAFVGLVIIVFIFELFYSINTNLLKTPMGSAGMWYSQNKIQNQGWNQLETFIRENIVKNLPQIGTIRKKQDIIFTNEDFIGKSVVIYDDRINWFAQMWYMQRYFLYYRWPIISASYLKEINIKDLMSVSGKPLYFIYPINPDVIDHIRDEDKNLNTAGPAFAKQLDTAKVLVMIIKNKLGVPAFKVYEIVQP